MHAILAGIGIAILVAMSVNTVLDMIDDPQHIPLGPIWPFLKPILITLLVLSPLILWINTR